MSIPILSSNTDSGKMGVTKFIFDSGITDNSYKIVWYFGDGGSYKGNTSQHIYYSPGTYTVTMLAYPTSGSPLIQKKNIVITLHFNNSINFNFIPPPTFAGHYNRYPFRVNITAPDIHDHYVNLGCQFSRSDSPQEVPNKWSFLRPQWRFFDINGNLIQKIKTKDTIIKINDLGDIDPNGTFVAGVTGYADFYFSDDIYNADLAQNGLPYTTIIATLDTLNSKDFTLQSDALNQLPSYANSLASATCPHIFLWRTPDYLKVSENGIRPYANPRWSDSNIPIIVTANIHNEFPDPFLDGNGVKIINPDSFFVHNFPLNNLDSIYVNLQITGYDINFSPTPSFYWTDESNYKIPGYYKGSFNFPEPSASNVQVDASLTFAIPITSYNYYNPFIWVSSLSSNQIYVTSYQKFKELDSISINKVPYTKSISFTNSYSANEYTIAAGHLPDYHAWVSDRNLKQIYHVSSLGQILTTVNIPSLIKNSCGVSLTGNQAEPVSLIMDGNKNVWFSLKNSLSTVKLDPYGNFLLATCPPIYDPTVSSGGTPTHMETNSLNDVYVSYSSLASGFLVRYSSDGSVINVSGSIYNRNLAPKQIVSASSDSNGGDTWQCIYSNNSKDYIIQKKSWDNNLLFYDSNSAIYAASYGPFLNVNHLTLDKDYNLWFTFNNQSLGKITNSTYALSTIEVFNEYSSLFTPNSSSVKGLVTDFSGKIFVINSTESQVYVIDGEQMTITDSFYVKNLSTFSGDCNGFNWINKYRSSAPEFFDQEIYQTISGSSNYLNFYTDKAQEYGLFKINENYDLAQTLKDHAFTPKLIESSVLFNEFFPAIFGKKPFNTNDLGVELYEKISNFSLNHNDIDTCGLDQLYNNAQMVDLITDDFRLNYPPELLRLMHLASINQTRLWGGQLKGGLQFSSKDQNGFFNRGSLISSFSYRVTGGIPLVLKNKTLYDPCKLIYTGRINGYRYYSLDTLAQYLKLPTAWRNQYEFYSYIPSVSGDYLGGIIDWNNPQTTINFENPTIEYWSGKEGVLETSFAYELYKGLNLLNS
jgi:streptogramin lyase